MQSQIVFLGTDISSPVYSCGWENLGEFKKVSKFLEAMELINPNDFYLVLLKC
jgi:hypothetical protein